MNITHNSPTAEEYIALRLKTGMGPKDLLKSEIALKNSLFIVGIWDKGKLIGFGRIVGDGGITFVVSDVYNECLKINMLISALVFLESQGLIYIRGDANELGFGGRLNCYRDCCSTTAAKAAAKIDLERMQGGKHLGLHLI